MKRVTDRLAAFEDEQIRQRPPDHARNLRIVEALYREAVALGAFAAADSLDGLDVDIRVARSLHVRATPR